MSEEKTCENCGKLLDCQLYLQHNLDYYCSDWQPIQPEPNQFVANAVLCPVCHTAHALPVCQPEKKDDLDTAFIIASSQIIADLRQHLANKNKVLRELLDIIRGIRPHFENTGLSCLEDCDEAIEMILKEVKK